MLRVSKLTDAEYVLEQVAGGLEGYYLGGGEAPGVWAGRLAGQLGLEGVVEADDLRALIDRVDPGTGDPLTPGTKAGPGPGFRRHFLGSKVGVVAACSGRPGNGERGGDRSCRRRGRSAGLLGGPGGGDPPAVRRCAPAGGIPNLVRRPDGTWAALDAAGLYQWAKAAGSIYQEHLRRNLTATLGVVWGADSNGSRELVGISEA